MKLQAVNMVWKQVFFDEPENLALFSVKDSIVQSQHIS